MHRIGARYTGKSYSRIFYNGYWDHVESGKHVPLACDEPPSLSTFTNLIRVFKENLRLVMQSTSGAQATARRISNRTVVFDKTQE